MTNYMTQILLDRIGADQKAIKRNTDLIEKLLERIVELERHIPELSGGI